MYAYSTFGGHFKEQLENVYDMRVVIPKSPIKEQPTDSKLVIHHGPGPPVRMDRGAGSPVRQDLSVGQ